jgi:aspartyl-tRNA(Asn)/glutamyl-tRNA(Gln) amidotransferase subunit C
MLSPEEVRAIARLARIEVADAEVEHLRGELNKILAMVDAMQAVDTAGIEPMAHPQDMRQRLRADEVTEPDRRSLYQSVAPATEDGLYLVPKVIE